MASIKKKSGGGGGGANWMDTYGDMVTLLLCFFVLLYSMSTIDQEKWMMIVQSFNKTAIVSTDDSPRGPEGDGADEMGGGMPATTDMDSKMEELLQFLQDTAAAPLAGELIVPAHIVFPQGRGRVAGYHQLVDKGRGRVQRRQNLVKNGFSLRPQGPSVSVKEDMAAGGGQRRGERADQEPAGGDDDYRPGAGG